MSKKYSLNLTYFFVSLALLSLLSFNAYFYSSSVIGSLTLLTYILVIGSWTGRLLFSQDEKLSQQLFGVIVVVCWIIISEGMLVIFKRFMLELLFFPLLILPLALLMLGIIIDRRIFSKITEEPYESVKENYNFGDFISIVILMIGLLGSLLSALYVRNDLMLFSIWEVIPLYFWIFMFITIISFVFLQKRIHNKPYGFEVSMICGFLLAFLFFGLMVLVVKISFDPDIWVHLSIVRVIFNLGGRDPTGGLIIPESGFQAILVTFAKSMGTTFDLASIQWVTWLLSPIMASIYIPFITYQFLKRLHSGDKVSHIFFLGAIGFMLFPTFWLMSVSVPEMVGDILMYVNLFFITFFISDVKPYRGLFLMALTTTATLLVHPFSGTFALMADLVAISFHRRVWEMKKIKYILLAITSISALLIFPSEFTWIQEFLYKGAPLQLSSISLEKTANFWFSPIWLPKLYTADSICSENFNWVRYALLILGFLALRPLKENDEERIKAWLILTIIVFWVSWFITVNGIENLPYGTHRFARGVDLALLPLASLILYESSKIDSLSFLLDGNIKMDNIVKVSLKWKKRKLPLVLSQNKLSATLLLSLIILGMLSSFYLAYSIPSFSKNNPAEPGRPTWRTVTGDEMKIVEYINVSAEGKDYCVLSYGFIPKLLAGALGYRYYGNECNLAVAPGLVSENTLKLMSNPSPSLIYETMVGTNSSVTFFVVEDWFVDHYSIQLSNIEKLKQFAADYKVFGNDYKFYVFKFDLSIITYLFQYIHSTDEYESHSPIIVADDEDSNFWSIFTSYGSGKMAPPSILFENYTKLSGNYSINVAIGHGKYGTVGIVHHYDLYQNWGVMKYINFFFHGEGSLATINIYIGAPSSDDAMSFTFIDAFVGWRWIKIPFDAFGVIHGHPDLARVGKIAFNFEDAEGTSFLIDNLFVDE